MEVLLKICSVAFIGTFVVGITKKSLPEMTVAASSVVLIVISLFSYRILQGFFDFIKNIAAGVHISESLILPLIKTVGISIVSKLACDMCREGGMLSVASFIEIISGAIALTFSFPMIQQIIGQLIW